MVELDFLSTFSQARPSFFLDIFDTRARALMIMIMMVQKTNIQPKAFLEDYGVLLEVSCVRDVAHQVT